MKPEPGHDSPEDAAMAGFPSQHVHVVGCQSSADYAHVLLNTGSPANPYLYGVNCSRRDGRWFEDSSGNGPSWTPTSEQSERGMLTFWGEAPAGAHKVLVGFNGTVHEAAVRDGVYFFVWWNVPCPMNWPRVI
jgi:hypothetical protein